jgi:hypothetical protein
VIRVEPGSKRSNLRSREAIMQAVGKGPIIDKSALLIVDTCGN